MTLSNWVFCYPVEQGRDMKGLEDSSAKNHDIHFFYFCKAHLSILLRCCRNMPTARAEITLFVPILY